MVWLSIELHFVVATVAAVLVQAGPQRDKRAAQISRRRRHNSFIPMLCSPGWVLAQELVRFDGSSTNSPKVKNRLAIPSLDSVAMLALSWVPPHFPCDSLNRGGKYQAKLTKDGPKGGGGWIDINVVDGRGHSSPTIITSIHHQASSGFSIDSSNPIFDSPIFPLQITVAAPTASEPGRSNLLLHWSSAPFQTANHVLLRRPHHGRPFIRRRRCIRSRKSVSRWRTRRESMGLCRS